MTLGGLLTPLVVPPVNLALLAGVALLLRRPRLAGVALAGLLLLALPVVADSLLDSLARRGRAAVLSEAQAIVVLGAEVEVTDGLLAPGPLTLQRLRWAAALARQTKLPVLVSGGVVGPVPVPVADIMANSLREDFAQPVRWVEGRSADTWENARDSAAILRADGIRRVVVVTHPWHMPRALAAFRDSGLAAQPAPLPVPASAPPDWSDLVPRASAWQRSYFALHEWIGLAWYELR